MDKESVVASLARNKKIAVETMTGQRYIIERILHTNDEKHIPKHENHHPDYA